MKRNLVTIAKNAYLLIALVVLGSEVALAAVAGSGITGVTCSSGLSLTGGSASGSQLSTSLMTGLSAVIDFIKGPFGSAIGVLAVTGVGIGALTGRVDWQRGLYVIVFIGIVFSAPFLVGLFC